MLRTDRIPARNAEGDAKDRVDRGQVEHGCRGQRKTTDFISGAGGRH